MIQRIQTLFLLVEVIAQAVLHFVSIDVELFGSHYIIMVLSFVSFFLALVAIFSYKTRPRQILLNKINLLINALLIGLLMYWLFKLSGGIDFPEKGIEVIFPFVSVICLFIANLYIKKDEQLVKSIDRIR